MGNALRKKANKVHQYLKEAFKDKPIWDNLNKPMFRGSALPVCPIQWVLTEIIITTANQPIKVKRSGIYSDYFLSEGSLIHTLLQKYLGANKILYGKWKCKFPIGEPDKRTGAQAVCNKVVGPQLGSQRCHGMWMEYEEYELLDKKSGLLIHVDAMLQLWGLRILGDFKTSKSAWSKDYVTPTGYYHQLNAYWWVLKEKGITFDLASLIYVPRDYLCCNPNNWILHPINPDYDKWKMNIVNKDKARKCINTKDWSLFKKFVKTCICNPEDEHFGRCMFYPICHPGAGIGRKSHYIELWEPYVEKSLTWEK